MQQTTSRVLYVLSMVRDNMKDLNEFQRLQVMEASCVYHKTSTMKEAVQPAVVEVSYLSCSTFKEAVDRRKLEPHIKRLSSSLSIPLVLDLLAKLFDTLLLDRFDNAKSLNFHAR